MSVAGVATVLNEEAIVGLTVEHLLAHGVDRVYIAHGPSTDDTAAVLAGFDEVVVVDDPSPVHYQPKQINDLAFLAHTEGFEWIIPFDADEFWCPATADTIADALDGLPESVSSVPAPQLAYHSLQCRAQHPNPYPKVAFRWQRGAHVANGNHSVSGLTGDAAHDVLVVREWQFQSLAHMRAKSRLRVATIDPALPYTEGTHQRIIAAMDESELATRWEQMDAEMTIFDPIPVRTR